MSDTVIKTAEVDGAVDIEKYAEQAYLDYAMSVVTGRALPDVADGEKPVQRRILYGMSKLGLTDKAKPTKCARFIGDVMGKYHPHGDSSIYDAAVRMAQPFSLRYPLVDGHGNFGSRDGDSAAAMRYTEARLTSIAELLLAELDMGTVDFEANYDGTMREPVVLPARLPMLLLNGASGIAVGMATEVPSHNLTEVALACEHLIANPDASLDDILSILPGPDFPGGAQVISSHEEVAKAYTSGRGSLRLRARWTVEPLARGQWQIAVTELPPGTSTAKVMAEIEELTNPQVKTGKKTLTQDQLNAKALLMSLLDHIADDSDEQYPVRLVIEPKSSRVSPDELMQVLLAHTGMESNFPMNLVALGRDGKPQQKGLLQVLKEWVDFRYETVTRRTRHRLGQVKARIHILEGRLAVFEHLDEVVRIIRESNDPRADLIRVLGLSDTQADDILEIRLRQLANMERAKLDAELLELQGEMAALLLLLDNRERMTAQILLEIAADRAKYGDARRTLIEATERITTSAVAVATDDPVTLVISKQGWLRARTGHRVDLSSLTWKPGDEALAVLEARTNQTVIALDTSGRAYNLAAAAFPTGRGDGVPASSLIELGGNRIARVFLLDPASHYLLTQSGGYGFICPGEELVTRQKAGKALMTLEDGETLLAPVALRTPYDQGEAVFASSAGKLLVCPLAEMKVMAKGRGVQLMSLNGKETVVAASACSQYIAALALTTLPAGPKKVTSLNVTGELEKHRGKRARAGAMLVYKAVVTSISAEAYAPGDAGTANLSMAPAPKPILAPAPPEAPLEVESPAPVQDDEEDYI